MLDLFSEKLIKISLVSNTKEEAIKELAHVLYENQRVSDEEAYIKDVFKRENELSTDLENGIAMPHAISSAVVQPSVAIGLTKQGIAFGKEGALSSIIILIAMPEKATREHIEVLSKVTSVFIDEANIDKVKQATTESEILALFKGHTEVTATKKRNDVYLIGATGCASGVAHTYLAAKSLLHAAEACGVRMKVETNGSIGVENSPTMEEINKATCIIIASDKAVDMARFDGKKIIYANAKEGINKAKELIERAMRGEGEVYHHKQSVNSSENKKIGGSIYKALMNGVSFMIPFVVIGGIMTALAFAIGGSPVDGTLVIPEGSVWGKIADMGSVGMTLMIPILGGYIAYAIGDRPALAPGMLGGWIAANGSFYGAQSGAGFLGAIVAGFIAGYVVVAIKKIKFPEAIQALVPIVLIPIVASLVVGFAFIFVIGAPISGLMDFLYGILENLNGGSLIILGIVVGLMQGFDMGGPVGKTLLMFSIASMANGDFRIMGAQAMGIPVAPLGMALATFMDRKKQIFNEEEKASGKAALVMGMCGISEGAIPFAAADPMIVIPANMIGTAVATTLSLLLSITDQIAWGGPIIVALGLTNNAFGAIVCMSAGSIVTGVLCFVLKRAKQKKLSLQ